LPPMSRLLIKTGMEKSIDKIWRNSLSGTFSTLIGDDYKTFKL
jgi:hypothetical protein